MGVSKYPVISENNQIYEVDVFFGESITYAGLHIVIYKISKGMFGRDKRKKLRHFRNARVGEKEILSKYSYVEIIKKYVREYEKEIADDIEYTLRRQVIQEEFEEWDGRI